MIIFIIINIINKIINKFERKSYYLYYNFFGIFYKNKEWARGVVLFLILKNNQRFDLKGKIKNYY
jgi:hypothetical protein